jgi:hypothetical protein
MVAARGDRMTEAELQHRIRLLSRGPVRLHRNNVGTGWAGPSTRVTVGNLPTVRAALRPGDVVMRQPRPLHAGLAVGSGDLIGWRSTVITGQHVGQTLAVFTSLELKTASGRVRPEQRQWAEVVTAHGGIAGIVRSTAEAEQLLQLCSQSKPSRSC